MRVDHVGTTSFRLGYDINRVDINRADIDLFDWSGQQLTLCAHVAITYVCVEIAGRKSTPITAGLREALATGHA